MSASQQIQDLIQKAEEQFRQIDAAAATLRGVNNVRHAKESRDNAVRFLERMRRSLKQAKAMEAVENVNPALLDEFVSEASTCAGMIGAYEYGVNFLLTNE